MIQFPCILLSLLYLAQCQHHNTTLPIRIPNIALSNNSTCSLLNTSAQRELVRKTLQRYYNSDGPTCSCGGEGWTRAVYLNMSDPNQQCPSNWALITTPVRGCGRRTTRYVQCDSVTYSVHGRSYSSVCGRILAYQRGLAGAFFWAIDNNNYNTTERAYLDGVSLTHGPAGSRQHIWSFVGAYYEQDPNYRTVVTCPCTNTAYSWPHQVPSFINNDYFCDTGNPGPGSNNTAYYTDDPLWDGEGCSSTSTCCEFNSPPWFCKVLPQPTSDDLEIRNCYANIARNEDKLITLIDIYVK